MKTTALLAVLMFACTVDIDARLGSTDQTLNVAGLASTETSGLLDFGDPTAYAKLRASDVLIDNTLQVGATVPEASTQKVVISSIDTGTRVMTTITSDGHTGHNSGGGSNQITNLWLQATGGFDTTIQNGTNRALEIVAACSVTSGPGSCEDTAIIANAQNGYSWRSETGTMRHDGPVQFGSGVSPATVSLGSNVQPFLMQGTAGTATQVHVGWATTPGNVFSGVQFAAKNAQTGVTMAGYGVALDTSVSGASGIRGGFLISRGAAGGLVSGNTMGIAAAGGSGFPFVASAADELSIFSQYSAGIVFGADNTGFKSGYRLTPNNHLVVDASTGAPTRNASCTSGTGSTIVGNDIAFKVLTGTTSTACTLTFVNTYTNAPICTITPEGTATMPTWTASATAITMTTSASATTYNVICYGQPGGT